MATTYEELKLTVTMTDNASLTLRQMQEEIKKLSSGSGGQAFDKLNDQVKRTTEGVKSMEKAIADMVAGFSPFTKGLILATESLVAFGFAVYKAGQWLNEFASKQQALNALSTTLGVLPGQLRIVQNQLVAVMSPEAAQKNLQGLFTAIQQYTKMGGAARQKFIEGAGQYGPGAMQLLEKMIGFGNRGEVAQAMNHFIATLNKSWEEGIAHNVPVQILARQRRALMDAWGVGPEILNYKGLLRGATREEIQLQKEMIELSFKWGTQWAKTLEIIEKMEYGMEKVLLPLFTELNTNINDTAEAWGESIGHHIAESIKDARILYQAIKDIYNFFNPSSDRILKGLQEHERYRKSVEGMSEWEKLKDLFEHGGGLPNVWSTPEVREKMMGKPMQFMGGGGGGDELDENTRLMKQLNTNLYALLYGGGGGGGPIIVGGGDQSGTSTVGTTSPGSDSPSTTTPPSTNSGAKSGYTVGDVRSAILHGTSGVGAGPAGAGGQGRYNQPGATGYSPTLSEVRAGFSQELKDPAIRDRFYSYTYAETGSQGREAQQAFMEETLNRAAARGQTLKQTLGGRYFPPRTHRIGAQTPSEDIRNAYAPILTDVMGGSNTISYGTGNASGTVGFGKGGYQTAAFGPAGQQERYGVEAADVGWARRQEGVDVARNMIDTGMAQYETDHSVDTSGSINIAVRNPAASAERRVAFMPVNDHRQTQMDTAEVGPANPALHGHQ
jgi:hypothetical protein